MYHRIINLLALLSILWLASSCGGQTEKQTPDSAVGKQFSLPQVPALLQTPEQRATFLVTHYWDNFAFADTTMIGNADVTEQAFADYIDLFPHTSPEVVERSIAAMMTNAMTGGTAMFNHFAELYEKYLDDPNSPFRNETYYIAVLRSIIDNHRVEESYKVRPHYQLEMALKNRPGNPATDFLFATKAGRRMKLSEVSAHYTVLFFNNPDCHDCARVRELLTQLSDPKIKVVAIYSDENLSLWQQTAYPATWINGATTQINDELQYELRAIPSLYLLDKSKRVILKDAPVESIIEYLNAHP